MSLAALVDNFAEPHDAAELTALHTKLKASLSDIRRSLAATQSEQIGTRAAVIDVSRPTFGHVMLRSHMSVYI